MEAQTPRKRVRDESANSELDSLEVKRLRENILEFLDDSDTDPSTQDLDSVIKSLQEEISAASCSVTPIPSPPPVPAPASVIDLTSDSGESQPELGFLLEASDDELGLPPSLSSNLGELKEENELVRVSSDSSGIGEFWGFEDPVPSYGSFELVTGESYDNGANEFVAFDGLFGYSDVYFDSSDFSDLSWRSETLPAQ